MVEYSLGALASLLDPDELDLGGAGEGYGPLGALSGQDAEMPAYLRKHFETGEKLFGESAGALGRYEKEATDALGQKRALIQQGLDRLLARQPDRTQLLMALAAGFLKPTRTGRFGESLGQAGEASLAPLAREQDLEMAREGRALEYGVGMAGIGAEEAKTRYAAALERAKLGRGLSGDALKLYNQRLTFLSRQRGAKDLAEYRAGQGRSLAELRDKLARGAGASPAGKQAADEGFEPGTKEYQGRVAEIGRQTPEAAARAQQQERNRAKLEMLAPKAKASLRDLEAQHATVDEEVTIALNQVSPWSTGVGSWLSIVPATDANALKYTLKTIAANIGFDKLQEIKANSPTGGALGSVTEAEHKLLQSVFGSLEQEQDPAQLKRNLLRVRKIIRESGQRRRAAFKETFGSDIDEEDEPVVVSPEDLR